MAITLYDPKGGSDEEHKKSKLKKETEENSSLDTGESIEKSRKSKDDIGDDSQNSFANEAKEADKGSEFLEPPQLADESDSISTEAEAAEKENGSSSNGFVEELERSNYFSEFDLIINSIEATNLWRKSIKMLCATFDDFLFDYKEIFAKPKYQLKRFNKVFLFNAPANFAGHNQRLLEIMDEIHHHRDQDKIPYCLSDFIFKNGDENDICFEIKALPADRKTYFMDSLSTLLLFNKILIRQQRQFEKMLIELGKIDEQYMQVLQEYSALNQLLKSGVFEDENIRQFTKSLFKKRLAIQDALLLVEDGSKLKTLFIKNMDRGLFNVYNEILKAKSLFIANLGESINENEASFFLELFDDLSKTILDYLKRTFSISPQKVKIGDLFDLDLHNLPLPPEPDRSLPDGSIKEIIDFGFVMDDKVIKMSDVLIVKN